MSKAKVSKIYLHYSACNDENCEVNCCVDRREFEHRDKQLRARIATLEEDLVFADQLRAEVERLREALENMLDPNPCMTDHNLFCQEHASAYPCVMSEARAAAARKEEK